MKCEKAVDTLIAISPKVADLIDRLGSDDAFKKLVEIKGNMSEASFLLRVIPILMTPQNRSDFYFVIAMLSGKSVEELKEAEFTEVLDTVRGLWKDETVRLFTLALFGNAFTEGA